MKNNGLTATVTKLMGYVFTVLVIGFSSYNTWELLHKSSGNLLIATLGLVLFEGGLIYWWLVFQNGSEGLPQMAISAVVFTLCLTGVVIANMVELGAYQLTLDSHLPQQLTVGALIVQLVSKLVFPLVSPETARKIRTKILEGQLIAKSETKLDGKMALVSDEIAERLSDIARDNLLLSLGHTTTTKTSKEKAFTELPTKATNTTDAMEVENGGNFLEQMQ